MDKLEDIVRDLITSVDPFASSKEEGIRFIGDLRDMLVEAGKHGTNSIEVMLNTISKDYSNNN